MSHVEERLRALGLSLPPPPRPPPGVVLPFQFVRIVGRRALISGHGPQDADGAFARPLGKLGRETGRLARQAAGSIERAYRKAIMGVVTTTVGVG